MPGEGRLHLLRRGQGALLPGLRRAHPRPRHALREPPALPRHGDPRRPRPRIRLRRRRPPPRRRPPRPRAQARLRPATPTAAPRGPARRVAAAAAGPLPAPVLAAGLGRRRAPAVLRLRVRRQAAQGFAPGLQGAGVVHGRHGAVPRPHPEERQGHHGGPRALRLAGRRRRGLLQDDEQGRRQRQRRRAPEQEGPGRDHRRRGLLHRARSWLNHNTLLSYSRF